MIKTMMWTIAALTFIDNIYSICSEGCLKCSLDDKCLFCDSFSGFYLIDQNCMKSSQTNCKRIGFSGECLVCETGYFLDQSTLKCISIPTNQIIENCSYQDSQLSCLYCQSGYYLSNLRCVKVLSEIPNCEINSSEDPAICLQCKAGFLIKQNRKECVSVSQSNNCQSYSFISCNSCQTGFLKDENNFIQTYSSFSSGIIANEFITWVNLSRNKYPLSPGFSTCKKILINNCSVFENPSACQVCNNFFYLTSDKKCLPFPLEPIENCKTYKTFGSCLECMEGFLLSSEVLCKAVTPIENCSSYSGTSSSSVCRTCNPDYYISNGGCSKRIDSLNMNNCEILASNADFCAQCKTNYIITNDFLKCLPKIDNCNTYKTSSKDMTELVCDQCSTGYYIDTSSSNFNCLLGSITNCESYLQNENKCQTCKKRYYLENSACSIHAEIKRCDTYHATIKNSCSICSPNNLLFSQSNGCIARTLIDNCLEYTVGNTCSLCKEGFAVDVNGSCVIYSVDPFCKKINNSLCETCKDNYVLWTSTNKCVASPAYLSLYCANSSISTNSLYTCNYCSENSLMTLTDAWDVCLLDDLTFLNFRTDYCSKYKSSNNVLKCEECQNGYFLISTTNTCSNTCDLTIVLTEIDWVNGYAQSTKRRLCKDIGMAQCKTAIVSNEATSLSYICVECKLNQFPFYNSSYKGRSHIVDVQVNAYSYNKFLRKSGVNCGNPGVLNFVPSNTSNPVQNCLMYNLIGGVNLGCIKCVLGRTGPATTGYLVNCDTVITDCDSSAIFLGLIGPKTTELQGEDNLDNFVSCFKCGNGKLPTLLVKYVSGVYSLEKFDTSLGPPTSSPTPVGRSMECMTPIAGSFSIAGTFNVIPSDCAFIVNYVNIAKSGDINNANPSVRCSACLPGFRPTFNSETITACTPISNCDTISSDNKVFNKCGKCQAGYTWGWSSTANQIDETYCVATTDTKCESYDAASSKCMICMSGYFLTEDNVCDSITIPKCNSDSFVLSNVPFGNTNTNIALSIIRGVKGHGCSSCESGYTKIERSYFGCFQSTYIASNNFKVGTKYIPNCQNYFYSDKTYCEVCAKNFLIMSGKLACVSINSLLIDCKVALTSSSCATCKTGKVLVNGICQSPAIDNCSIYVQGSITQTCQTCSDGYYLSSNKCIKGKITNCANYSSQTVCSSCVKGFLLLTIKDSSSYCFPVPLDANCDVYDNTAFAGFQLSCSTCNSGFVITTDATKFQQSACLPFTLIENCVSYSFGATFGLSSFKCSQCNKDNYLEENVCILRKYKDSNCVSFNQSFDECTACSIGTFLSIDKKSCVENPKGIAGCFVYANESNCLMCKENKYILNNKCLDVPTDKVVTNCLYYKELGSCSICNSTTVAVNGKCEQLQATDCSIAKDSKSCSKCPLGYGLKEENGLINCVKKTDSNCSVSEDLFPFNCTLCNQDYYPLLGKCEQISNSISGCLFYENKDSCKICQKNMYLSADKKSCESGQSLKLLNDIGCYDNRINADPVCRICEEGFYFDAGVCAKCKNGIENGCWYCDPLNSEKCLLCKVDYYQDKTGACVPLIKRNANNSTNTSSGFTISVLISFIAIVLYL